MLCDTGVRVGRRAEGVVRALQRLAKESLSCGGLPIRKQTFCQSEQNLASSHEKQT